MVFLCEADRQELLRLCQVIRYVNIAVLPPEYRAD